MVTALRIIQVVLLLVAGLNAMTALASKQMAFAQVCEMVGVVATLQLVAILQRTGHRMADTQKAEKLAAAGE